MRLIMFMPFGSDRAYCQKFPGRNLRLHFTVENAKQEVPDDIAEMLIAQHPKMFGYSRVQLQDARGGDVSKIPKRLTVPRKLKRYEHPAVAAIRKAAVTAGNETKEEEELKKVPPAKKPAAKKKTTTTTRKKVPQKKKGK